MLYILLERSFQRVVVLDTNSFAKKGGPSLSDLKTGLYRYVRFPPALGSSSSRLKLQ